MSRHPDMQASDLVAELRARCAALPDKSRIAGHRSTLAVIDITAHLGVLWLQGDPRSQEVADTLATDPDLLRRISASANASATMLEAAVRRLTTILRDHPEELDHAVAFADDPAEAEARRVEAVAGVTARETLARLVGAAKCLRLESLANRLSETAGRHDAALRDMRLGLFALVPVRARLAEELGAAGQRHWWLADRAYGHDEEEGDEETGLPDEVAHWLRDHLVDGPGGVQLQLTASEARAIDAGDAGGSFVAWMGDRLSVAADVGPAEALPESPPVDAQTLPKRLATLVARSAEALSERLVAARSWRLQVPEHFGAWTESFLPADLSALAAMADDGGHVSAPIAGSEAPVGFQVGRAWVEPGFGVVAWGSRLAGLVQDSGEIPGETLVGGWLLFPRPDVTSMRLQSTSLTPTGWHSGGVFVEQPTVDGELVQVVYDREAGIDQGPDQVIQELHLDRPAKVDRPSGLELAIDLLTRDEAATALDLLLELREQSPELGWADVDGLGRCAAHRAGDDASRPWS